MINLMYLVLTALLALNVSAEVLKAFTLVNQGLIETNTSFAAKNETTYKQFAKQLSDDKAKVQPLYDRAMIAKAKADAMYKEIDDIKAVLVERGGGYVESHGSQSIKAESSIEIGTEYFVAPSGDKMGPKLLNDLKTFETEMLNLVDKDQRDKVRFKMPTDYPKESPKPSWESYYFESVPLIATITELTKFQNDVRNAESEVVKHLFGQIGASDFKFDGLVPIVKSNKAFVLSGQPFEAEVFLGAYSSTQNPVITINGEQQKVERGKAIYKTTTSGQGERTVKGTITLKDPSGKDTSYPFSTNYQVFQGSAVISADKMNVVYVGLENPISVSVPGFAPELVTANVSGGGTWTNKGKGQYIFKPNGSAREVKVTANAKTDGGSKMMGSQTYRVRQVPKPVVYFGTKDGGSMSRGELATVNFVSANLGEGFAFEGLNYTVRKFVFALSPKQATSGGLYQETISGNRLSAGAKSKMASARPGDILIIAEVEAVGPTGVVRMNGTNFTIR